MRFLIGAGIKIVVKANILKCESLKTGNSKEFSEIKRKSRKASF